ATLAPAAPSRSIWQALADVRHAIDRGFVWFATPLGVKIVNPWKRFALFQGIFLAIYIVGLLPIDYLPLITLTLGYVGVLAVGRAWVVNEKQRTRISKKLEDGNPDAMPDLRWSALISALQLLVLFPLFFYQLHRQFGWYKVEPDTTLLDWFRFTLDKTYLKALPGWSVLYGIHVSGIEFDASWGKHLVLLSRLTFDYILLQGIFRLLAIRATINEAVAAVKC